MGDFPPEIIPRRVKIDFPASHPERWAPEADVARMTTSAFSLILPAGEAFFARSVENYLGKISDPVLADQARRFIYQERAHAREHSKCNVALRRAYPGAARIERFNQR